MINMLKALMNKVDSMQEQMGNASRELDILRENQKEMLAITNTVAEMKNGSDVLSGRLNIAKVEDISAETSKTGKKREERLKKQKIKDCGITTTDIQVMRIPEGEERNKNIGNNNNTECPQRNVIHQTTDPGSTKQD